MRCQRLSETGAHMRDRGRAMGARARPRVTCGEIPGDCGGVTGRIRGGSLRRAPGFPRAYRSAHHVTKLSLTKTMSSTFFDVDASEASRRPGEPGAGRAYMRTRSTSVRLAATSESRPPSATTSTASSGRAEKLDEAKVEGYAGATEVEAPPARAHGADGPRGEPPPRGTGAPLAFTAHE